MLFQNMLTPVDDVEVLVLVDNKTDSLSRSQEESKLQSDQIHLPMDHLRLKKERVAVIFLVQILALPRGGGAF